METVYTQELDPVTNKCLALYLYTDVKNMPEFRKLVLSGGLQCSILKASIIIDPWQIAVAANKVVRREHLGMLATKSIFIEMIYLLSSSDSISASLVRFGAHDDDKNVILAVIYDKDDRDYPNKIITHIDGELTSFSRLPEFRDLTKIKKAYKISDDELATSNLLDSVVSRIGGTYPLKAT